MVVVGFIVLAMIMSAIGDVIEAFVDYLAPVLGFLVLIGLLIAVFS
jgi:hypothetical protein